MSRGPNAQPVRYYERTSMYYHRLWVFRYTASRSAASKSSLLQYCNSSSTTTAAVSTGYNRATQGCWAEFRVAPCGWRCWRAVCLCVACGCCCWLPSRLRDVVVLLKKKKKTAGGHDREPCVREPCVRTRVHVLVQQTPPVLQHPRGDCIKDEGYGARTWNKNNKNIKLSPRCARPKSLHVWHGRWRS